MGAACFIHYPAATKSGIITHELCPGELCPGELCLPFLTGIARALASTLLCPVTVVKTRMEYGGAGAVRYKDTWDALSSIARAEGPRGLFRGLVPTVMTTAPFSGKGGKRSDLGFCKMCSILVPACELYPLLPAPNSPLCYLSLWVCVFLMGG